MAYGEERKREGEEMDQTEKQIFVRSIFFLSSLASHHVHVDTYPAAPFDCPLFGMDLAI